MTGGSQVAVGHHILQIGDLHGDLVYVQKGKLAPPRQRPRPVSLRPRPFPALLDREAETTLSLTALSEGRSVECFGESGSGKTSLIRYLAHQSRIDSFSAGVLYFSVNQQSASDMLRSLFDAFYEPASPVKPSDTEIRAYLQNLNALVLLDDVAVSAPQIEHLMNMAASCTFLTATSQRTLPGETQAVTVGGLPNQDALRLFERELGRELSADERQAAERLCESLGCLPQRVLRAASQAREKKRVAAPAIVAPSAIPPDGVLAAAELESRSKDERKVLAALAVFSGAPVTAEHIIAISDVGDASRILTDFESRGMVQSHNNKYSLSSDLSHALSDELNPVRLKALMHFESWTAERYISPEIIADSAEPALAVMRWGVESGFYPEVRRLGHSIESALAMSGKWDMWSDALQGVLKSSRAEGNEAEEAWALHQLGTRALCLGVSTEAATLLGDALTMRESIGDKAGAAATRHNLQLIAGPPPIDDKSGSHDSSDDKSNLFSLSGWPARIVAGIAALAVVGYFFIPRDDQGPIVNGSTPVTAEIARFDVTSGDGNVAGAPAQFQLCYEVRNAARAEIDNNIGAVALDGPHCQPVSPTQTTVYTLTATGPDGAVVSTQATANVVKQPLPPPQILGFKADPAAIRAGTPARLCFRLKDAASVQIDSVMERREASAETQCIDITPTTSTTYVLTAFNGEGASSSSSADIKVAAPLKHAQIFSFTAVPDRVAAGTPIQLCYTIADAERVFISPLEKPLPTTSGCVPHSPKDSTRYELTVIGEDRQRETRALVVAVTRGVFDSDGFPPGGLILIVSLRPDSQIVRPRTAARICYETSGIGTVKLPEAFGDSLLPANGCVSVRPRQLRNEYHLTVTSRSGRQARKKAIVKVSRTIPPGSVEIIR